MPPKSAHSDDLRAADNMERIDNLESFKAEFEGVGFYKKISDAISKSRDVA